MIDIADKPESCYVHCKDCDYATDYDIVSMTYECEYGETPVRHYREHFWENGVRRGELNEISK